MKNPSVSVVIPAYNEEKYIPKTLNSLLESEQGTKVDYEVVLVDNNSTDKTIEVAKRFASGMNLRIIQEKKQGRGPARARGFREAKGEIILSADADTIFFKGWVEEMSSNISGNVIATTTSCKITDASFFTNTTFNFLQPIFMVSYWLAFGHYWLSGFSFGILKSVYEKAGGFDETLQGQEDIDLGFRVRKLGKIKFINHPVVFSSRRFRKGIMYGLYEYVKTFIELFVLKNKDVYLGNPR